MTTPPVPTATATLPDDAARRVPPPPAATSVDADAHELRRLLAVMAALRDPLAGCPWDRAQDFDSIAPYTIEEGYEVADAIARRDWEELPDELGDLLFQVVYHARLAQEAGRFAFADVARAITDKMLRRHPHVFGPGAGEAGPAPGIPGAPTPGAGAAPAPGAWERAKQAERDRRAPGPVPAPTLAGVPTALPALTRAAKLTARAARVGFDWPDAAAVFTKLDEEVAELRAELPAADPARLRDELGDLLFVLANLARKLGQDPETCLRHANDKFARRFGVIEQALALAGKTTADATLAEMEAGWQAAKAAERA